jgi:glutamate synthase domain-containing protein 2
MQERVPSSWSSARRSSQPLAAVPPSLKGFSTSDVGGQSRNCCSRGAKVKAEHITIVEHDGGTGVSLLSSNKHVGLPWELGIVETRQVLVENNLPGLVIL